MDIDPAAAASAAAHIAEFASASADVLEAGASEGRHHGAIVPFGLPSEFLRKEQEEEEAWNAQLNVGREILEALDRAFQLHQRTDYQVSQGFMLQCHPISSAPSNFCHFDDSFHASAAAALHRRCHSTVLSYGLLFLLNMYIGQCLLLTDGELPWVFHIANSFTC